MKHALLWGLLRLVYSSAVLLAASILLSSQVNLATCSVVLLFQYSLADVTELE